MKRKLATLVLLPIFVINMFSGNIAVMADEFESGEPTTATTVVEEPVATTSSEDKSDGESETPPADTPSSGDTNPAEDPASTDGTTDGTNATDGETPSDTDGTPADTDGTTVDGETPTTDGEPDQTDGETPENTDDVEVTEPSDEQVVSAPAMRGVATGDAICGEDAYAILYDDGRLVIQKGEDTESENIVAQYLLDATNSDMCSNNYNPQVTSVEIKNRLVGRTSFDSFFAGCNFTEIDVSNIDFSQVTTATGMFAGNTNLKSLDISMWDTSSATGLGALCSSCSSLETVNMDNLSWNSATSSGNMLGGAFAGCSSLSSISMKNWSNLPSVMEHCFGRSWNITNGTPSIDVSGWDTSNVSSFNGLFAGCSVKTLTGLNTWNTSNVTDMFQCFNGMSNLKSLDISNWNFANVTNTGMMFSSSFTTLTLPASFQYVGNYGDDLASLPSDRYWVHNDTLYSSEELIKNFPEAGTYSSDEVAVCGVDAYALFYADGTVVLQKGDAVDSAYGSLMTSYGGKRLITATNTLLNYSSSDGKKVTRVIVKDFIVGRTTFESLFGNYRNMTEVVDIYKLDASQVTSCKNMFGSFSTDYSCSSLTYIDLSRCNFNSCTTFETMFNNCVKLETVIMPSTTGSLTTCREMFKNCTSLKTAVLPFDTTHMTKQGLYYMFRNCTSLEVTPEMNWDLSNASDEYFFGGVFYDCTSLKEADLSGWIMPTNARVSGIFYNCPIEKITVGADYHNIYGSSSGYSITNAGGTWAKVGDLSKTYNINSLLGAGYLASYAGTYVKVNKTLYFYPEGGIAEFTSLNLTGEKTEVVFPTITRNGYEFLGWFDEDGNKVEQYDPESTVTEFYAHWNLTDSYTLVLDSNRDGVDDITKTLAFDERFYFTDGFTSDNEYILLGYNTEADGSGTSYALTDSVCGLGEKDQTVTLYAQWKKVVNIDITIHYVSAIDGSTIYPDEVIHTTTGAKFLDFGIDYNQKYDDKNVIWFWSTESWLDYEHARPIFEEQWGYTINKESGWSYNYYGENNNPYGLIHQYNTKFNENTELYAYIVPPAHYVIHWADFVTNQYDEEISIKIFGEWYKDGELTVDVPFYTGSEANFTHNTFSTSIYISMGWYRFKATDYIDGLTSNNAFNPDDKFCYLYSSLFAVSNPVDPTTGNINWNNQVGRYTYHTEYDEDGQYYYVYDYDNRVFYGETADVYLILEPKLIFEYCCEIPVYNGTATSTYTSVVPGSGTPVDLTHYQVTYLPTVNRQGYDLVGWVDSEGNPVTTNTIIDLTKNNVLYAVWELNGEPLIPDDPTDDPVVTEEKVTITFDSQGGTEFEPITINKYGKVGLGSYIPTNGDKYFMGWYDESGQAYSTKSATTFAKDTTLIAHWAEQGYIYFDTGANYNNSFRSNGLSCPYVSMFDSDYRYRGLAVIEGRTVGSLPSMYDNSLRFIGWFDANDVQLTTSTVPTFGTIYYPKFAPLTDAVNTNGIAFECSAYWDNNDSDEMDNEHLYFSSGLYHREALLHISLNVLENSNDIPEGNIKILVPRYIFQSNTTNLSSELPKYPNTSSEMFFSYQEDSSNYIISNTANLTNSSAGLNLTITYNSKYRGYAGTSSFPVQFLIDTDNDGEFETTKEYTLYIKTGNGGENKLSSVYGRGTAYTVWQSDWGTAPANSSDYFYVMWNYTVQFSHPVDAYSQIYLYDTENNEGELVGFGSNGSASGYQYVSDNDGYSYMYVLYRYPTSMIDPETGRVTIEHTGKIIFDGVEGEYTAQAVDYRFNLVTRDEANFMFGRVGYYPEKNSQNALLNGSAISNLEWYAQYQNVSPLMTTTVDGVTEYSWASQRVTLSQQVGDVYLSSGKGDQYCMWNPPGGNIVLTENDYSFSKLTVYINTYSSEYTDNADVAWTLKQKTSADVPYEVWIRRTGDSDWLLYEANVWSGGNYAATITLPANTVEWKVIATSMNNYYFKVKVDPFITLKPTTRVQTQVQSDFDQKTSTVIKCGFRCDLEYDNENFAPINIVIDPTYADPNALEDLFEIVALPESDLYLYLSIPTEGMTNDATNRVSNVETYVAAKNYHGKEETPITPIESGIFYILLPEACPNPTQIWVYGSYDAKSNGISNTNRYSVDKSKYEYEYITNWMDSNRTMLKVNVHDVDYSQIWIGFNTQRSYQDSILLGNSAIMSAFFVNTTDDDNIYDAIYSAYGAMNANERQYYVDLYEQYNTNYIAASNTTVYYYLPTSESYGLFGSVARSDNKYTSTVSVVPGEEYSYKIYYGQSQDKVSTNIVIQDTLDGMGTFQNIYVPTISGYTTNNTATTSTGTVWYCLTPNPDFDNVDAEHGWTSEKPVGEKVYGIIVDYSKDVNGNQFVLGNGTVAKAFNIIIYEKADALLENKEFNNTAVMYREEKQNGVFTELQPSTQTTYASIHMPVINVTLTSNPESGTADAPREVFKDDTIIYYLNADNRETTALSNVVITDTLPSYVTISEADIKINGTPIKDFGGVTYTLEGNKLTVYVDKMDGVNSNNHSYDIEIPCKVNTAVPNILITNNGQVTSFNGIDLPEDKIYNSNTTYHITAVTNPDPTGFNDTSTTVFVCILCIAMAFMFNKLIFRRRKEEI